MRLCKIFLKTLIHRKHYIKITIPVEIFQKQIIEVLKVFQQDSVPSLFETKLMLTSSCSIFLMARLTEVVITHFSTFTIFLLFVKEYILVKDREFVMRILFNPFRLKILLEIRG